MKPIMLVPAIAFAALFTSIAEAGQGPQPSICVRACWGARAPKSSHTQMGALTRAIVHHTAGPSDYTTDYETGKARVRGVQNIHMDANGWSDIGYHFLVTAGGHIYEGRFGTMTSLPRGAHDGNNSNSFGFTLLGYFHSPYNHQAPAAMRNSLYDVIAWRMPSSWSPYGAGSYNGNTVGFLDGHRKVKATACPGDTVHPVYITENYNGGEMRNAVNARKNPPPPSTPPYLFGAGTDGWFNGHSTTSLGWNGSGWPGVVYTDQTGNDPYIYGPSTSFTGKGQGLINVSLYPQNGTTSDHDIQVFYKTAAENFWDASKSSPIVNYVAKNSWATINLYVNGPKWTGQTINQLRLDFDNINQGNRWIVNHVVMQSSLRWHFNSNTMGWTAGNNVTNPWWSDCCGWPGILVVDQTGNDAYIYSGGQYFDSAGPYKYIGGVNDRIHVRVYPQYGTSPNHNMQVFWRTVTDPTWTESKSVYVTYTGQNQWVDVYLPVGSNPNWMHAQITDIRLDFDNVNQGNRWIIDFINFEH